MTYRDVSLDIVTDYSETYIIDGDGFTGDVGVLEEDGAVLEDLYCN